MPLLNQAFFSSSFLACKIGVRNLVTLNALFIDCKVPMPYGWYSTLVKLTGAGVELRMEVTDILVTMLRGASLGA